MALVGEYRMINIIIPDCRGSDHLQDCPIPPVNRTEFVEIENKLSTLPDEANY
jgi:hypothetical protein